MCDTLKTTVHKDLPSQSRIVSQLQRTSLASGSVRNDRRCLRTSHDVLSRPRLTSRTHIHAALPTTIKRGLALLCQMLKHDSADTVNNGHHAQTPLPPAAAPTPAPPAADPLAQQQQHNMNGHAFIKVVGVGGGGGNAIQRMIDTGLQVRGTLMLVHSYMHYSSLLLHHLGSMH